MGAIYTDVIITKSFFSSFSSEIHSKASGLKVFKDLFFKKLKNVVFYTEFKDIQEHIKESEKNAIWEELLNNANHKFKYEPNLREAYKQKSFYKETARPFKIFFVDEDEQKCDELTSQFGYDFICISNLQRKSSVYLQQEMEDILPALSIGDSAFNSWSRLRRLNYPLNSIIICDNYLFKEYEQDEQFKRKTDRLFSLENNLLSMLQNLINYKITGIPIEILILSFKFEIKLEEIDPSSSKSLRLQVAGKRVEDFLRNEFPDSEFKVSVIHYDKDIHKKVTSFTLHDRLVITNYLYFAIDCGFNIFNINNKLIKSSEIRFNPYFCQTGNYCENTKTRLSVIKSYLLALEAFLAENPDKKDKYLFGSLNNRLLDSID